MPEFPERVREKAVLDMALRTKLMVGSMWVLFSNVALTNNG